MDDWFDEEITEEDEAVERSLIADFGTTDADYKQPPPKRKEDGAVTTTKPPKTRKESKSMIQLAEERALKALEQERKRKKKKAREGPEDDKEALQTLHRVAGRDWRTVNGTLFIYRNDVWSTDENAFYDLVMRHDDALGAYGRNLTKMRSLSTLAKTKNVESDSWTQQLDRLPAGLVPFLDGIYDVSTSELRQFDPSDMITKKFAIKAPSDENRDFERHWVKDRIADMFPDERLRLEVMVRTAESFFSPTNTDKSLNNCCRMGTLICT